MALSLALLLASPLAVRAVDDTQIPGGVGELKKNLNDFGGKTGLSNNQGQADLKQTVANIINIVLGLLGVIAVIMLLLAGFRWMTAGGNEQTVTDAKNQIKNALIGLAVIFMAWAITNFTINQLRDATDGGSSGGGTGQERSFEPDGP